MSAPTMPITDLAHLGHVEVLTDKFDESLDFFTRIYGLKLSGQDETSAYLRAWDDYDFHSMKLTRSDRTGVGHIGYRVSSPEALERRVAAIEASDFKTIGWVDGDMGGEIRLNALTGVVEIRDIDGDFADLSEETVLTSISYEITDSTGATDTATVTVELDFLFD